MSKALNYFLCLKTDILMDIVTLTDKYRRKTKVYKIDENGVRIVLHNSSLPYAV
jgi:hypothetical protein